MTDNLRLYNEEIKLRFLERYPKNTARVYHRVLSKCAPSEQFYNKDVCNFTIDEYTWLLKDLNAKSSNSIKTQNSAIKTYIDFANYVKFSDPNKLVLNVATMFKSKQLLQFVRADARERKYLDSEELDEFVEFCANEQDSALIQALREGIKGLEGDELINLKPEHINAERKEIQLFGENGNRVITVRDNRTIELLMAAYNQEIYLRKNGESTNKNSPHYYLPNTPYIFKPTGRDRVEPANYQILRRRLKSVAKWYGNPFLTITNILKAGAIEYTQQMMAEKQISASELTTTDYEKICIRYGINPARTTVIKQLITHYA